MKIIGHNSIESDKFFKVSSIKNISLSPANSIIYLSSISEFIDIAKYCKKNKVRYAVQVQNIKDAIFANILNSTYIISSQELAIKLMPIAQNYLFDTEILAEIEFESMIEEIAIHNIDGVIFLKNIFIN